MVMLKIRRYKYLVYFYGSIKRSKNILMIDL